MHREAGIQADLDLAPQTIEREPAGQCVGLIHLAIEQQIVAIRPDQEVEQSLALGGQQPGPDRQGAGHVIGDEALEEATHILARQADHGAIGKGGRGHIRELGSGLATGNGRDGACLRLASARRLRCAPCRRPSPDDHGRCRLWARTLGEA